MAWLRSEQSLLHHPKTAHLQVLLKVDKDIVIGRLHRLWWWCLDYALDGDLSKQGGKVIEQACGIPLQALLRAGFVDSRPYRRIHDWWGNQGAYLRSRFHKDPEKWQRIESLYKCKEDMSKDMSKHSPRISPIKRTDVENGRTDVTDVRTDVDVKDARADALGLAASPPPRAPLAPEPKSFDEFQNSIPESERMTPEEMKAIRLKNLGPRK